MQYTTIESKGGAMSEFNLISVHHQEGESMVDVPSKAVAHTAAWQATRERAQQRALGEHVDRLTK